MIFTLAFFLVFCASVGADELLAVDVVIRHGDRASSSGWATPESEQVFFRGHYEISDAGIENSHTQGRWFKHRYVDTHFIDSRYLPNEVLVRSSPVDRCLMSASAFLAGMFGRTKPWFKTIVPPVFTAEQKDEWMCYPHMECMDGWDDAISRLNLNTSLGNYNKQAADALVETEWPCPTVPGELYDAIVNELPNPLIVMPLNYAICARTLGNQFMYKYVQLLAGAGSDYNAVRIRRNAGMLTNQLLSNFQKAAECSATPCVDHPRMNVFYTHNVVELGIAHIFGFLDVFEGIAPESNSALVFETRRNETHTYVKTILKDGHVKPFRDIGNCANGCSLEEVVEKASPFALTEPLYCVS